MHKLEIV